MKELGKEVMNAIPQYLVNFSKLVASPRQFPVQQLPAGDAQAKASLTEALKFMLISLVLLVLLNTYRLEKEVADNIYTALGATSIQLLVYMCLIALAIYLPWKLFGTQKQFTDYLIIYSYNFGIIFIIITLFGIIADGYLKTNDPQAFAEILALKRAGKEPTEAMVQRPHIRNAVIINFAGEALGIVWAWIGWGAYRIMNQTSRTRAFFIMLLAIVFVSVATWVSNLIERGLNL